MTKVKVPQSSTKVPHKSLHSRVSYLYQAATYLATYQHSEVGQAENNEMSKQPKIPPILELASQHLISDLRSVSLKVQMRVSPAMKHTICKNCDSLLLDDSTSTTSIENRSKGGKKPWADVLVRKCNACGVERRYPLAARRQNRKSKRLSNESSHDLRTKHT